MTRTYTRVFNTAEEAKKSIVNVPRLEKNRAKKGLKRCLGFETRPKIN
jgi:hypothetical protein